MTMSVAAEKVKKTHLPFSRVIERVLCVPNFLAVHSFVLLLTPERLLECLKHFYIFPGESDSHAGYLLRGV